MIRAAANAVLNFVQSVGNLTVLYDGGHPKDSALLNSLFGAGINTKAGVPVTENTAMTLSAVYCAVTIYAETISSLPLRVYRLRPGGGRDIVATNPADYLLHIQANPAMTAKVLRRQLEVDRLLWGNAYARIHWDIRGGAEWLERLKPWEVEVRCDYGTLTPQYRDLPKNAVIPSDSILHVPGLGFDGVCGKSVIHFAREQLGEAIAEQDHAAAFFGNGAVPVGVLKHPSTLTAEARANLRQEWNDIHSGGANAGKIAVLWHGMDYQSITMPSRDAQFLESRQFSITEIARWFNLPPHLIKDLTRSTNNNIEHQGIEFVTLSLLPVLVAWEQEINRKLLAPPNVFAKHNVNALLRGDSTARAAFYREGLSWGYFSINDVRDFEELNPVAGGDRYFVPMNMTPLDRIDEQIDKQVEPAPEPEPPAEPPDDEPETESPTQAALLKMFANQLTRFCRVAANEARRAAQQPSGYVAKLNAVFDELPPKLASHIDDALECLSIEAGCKVGEKFPTEFLKAMYDDLVVLAAHPLALSQAVEKQTSDESMGRYVAVSVDILRGELCKATT